MKKYFLFVALSLFGCSSSTSSDNAMPGYSFYGNGVIVDHANDTICYCALYRKPFDSLFHGNLILTSGILHSSVYGYQPPSGAFSYCYCDPSSNFASGEMSTGESLVWDETKADYKQGYVKIAFDDFMTAYIFH